MLLAFFTGLSLCFVVTSTAQITAFQISLKDSTQEVLYVGIPNKVTIKGLPEHARVKFGRKYIKSDTNNYILNPDTAGNRKLIVYGRHHRVIFSKDYTARYLGHCDIQLGIVKYPVTSVEDILVNPALVCNCSDSLAKPFFRITQYDIGILVNGVYDTQSVTGDNLDGKPFDSAIISKISKMKNGDAIFIEGIRAYGPDGHIRSLNSFIKHIAFNITDTEQNTKLRPVVSVIVKAMVARGVVMGSGAGWVERLQDIATDSELIQLTDDDNPVVRSSAFLALASKKSIDPFPILLKHLNDTSIVNTQSGDVSLSWPNNVNILGYVHPSLRNNRTSKLTQSQVALVDSILLFDSALIFDKGMRDFFLMRMKPELRHYEKIRAMAVSGKQPTAIFLLAKFKNKDDVAIIKQLFEEPHYYNGIRAARSFPDEAFYPFLKSKFEEDLIAPVTGADYSDWEMLCEALAKYPTKETVKLFQKVASLKNQERYQIVGEHVLTAINKYPNPVFETLKKKIQLDDMHEREMKRNIEIEIW